MLWIIGFLTVLLVLDSLFLILLVLVQLPKKEAGLGQAFGSSATDALFGAGSGNALTKMTKYSTGIFFSLTLVIYLMYNHQARSRSGVFATQIQKAAKDVDLPVNPAGKTDNKATPATPLTTSNPPSAGALGTTIGTNAPPVSATVPSTGNTNVRGLLTVPQSPPSGTNPSTTTKPSAEATPKPAAGASK